MRVESVLVIQISLLIIYDIDRILDSLLPRVRVQVSQSEVTFSITKRSLMPGPLGFCSGSIAVFFHIFEVTAFQS